MFVRIDPYPACNFEHQVVAHILDGQDPFTLEQMSNIGALGGAQVAPDAPWLTNGIWSVILRCWNQDTEQRPNAAACARQMHELMKRVGQSFSEIGLLGDELIPVSADVKNLSGNVSCSDSERKNTLGYSVGWWRYVGLGLIYPSA